MQTRFIRRREAAKLLGVSERSLEDWSLTGGGPPEYRPNNRRVVLYDVAELEAWVREGARRSTSDTVPPPDRAV